MYKDIRYKIGSLIKLLKVYNKNECIPRYPKKYKKCIL